MEGKELNMNTNRWSHAMKRLLSLQRQKKISLTRRLRPLAAAFGTNIRKQLTVSQPVDWVPLE